MTTPIVEALSHNDIRDQLRSLVDEYVGGETDSRWVWVRDVGDDWAVYEITGKDVDNPGLFQIGYTVTDDVVALDGDAFEVVAQTDYKPKPEPAASPATAPAPAPAPAAADESHADVIGACIPLVEATVRRDGTVPIKLIEDGWNASGQRYYPRDVLIRDGATAFPAGTHMYWDHPTASEESERPERSLRDLAGNLVSDARWDDDGPEGPGLYADAQVFEGYRGVVDELAPHIGVSIRATGQAHHGSRDGRDGQIIERIVQGRSVDFVTAPGAGGEIVQMFESARGRPTRKEPTVGPNDTSKTIEEATRELEEARALGSLAAADRDREREQRLLREARDHVGLALLDDQVKLPDVTKARLLESLAGVAATPPVTGDGQLDRATLSTRVAEAVKAEQTYLASLGESGTVRNLGDGTTPGGQASEEDQKVAEAKAIADFQDLGLSEAEAKAAVRGR